MTAQPRKLPKSVTIGGRRISIKVDPKCEDWGQYHHDAGTIIISGMATKREKHLLETVRHEIAHAALHISGVAYSENLEEEAIVRCMDTIFFPAWERFLARYKADNKTKHD